MYEVSQPITLNDTLNSLFGKAKIGMQWIWNRSGPLAIGINMGGMFCRSLPGESSTPDTQFHFATLSADHAAGQVHPSLVVHIPCVSFALNLAARYACGPLIRSNPWRFTRTICPRTPTSDLRLRRSSLRERWPELPR